MASRLPAPEVGSKWGKLTITSAPYYWQRSYFVKVDCDCGARDEHVCVSKLLKGQTKSCGCTSKLAPGEGAMSCVISGYIRNATKRNQDYLLPRDVARKIFKSDCIYCGAKPSNVQKKRKSNGDFVYNGIDRIDNSIGYVIGNVVPCCKRCNVAKNDMPMQSFSPLL